MATYSTDADLLKYRPNILSLGVDDWANQRAEAYSIINRTIVARWYNAAAVAMGYDPTVTYFDPTQVETGFFKRLECYKTLELAYMHLMKDSPEADGFERNMDLFSRKYGEELDLILATGVNYDWNDDDEIDDDETLIPAQRRLYRS